ncbi:hypothetical protein CDV55_102511 [Aspergillus turcosus]|nr:hypothetical protein CDV55_102511 [Aspergillus turcosus]
MGFGDFFSAAIGAVKNLVSHSPIVKSLAPLAGIISHAVPIVGPIIDNAIPAIEAIFSKDNTSPNPGEDPKPPTVEQLNAPVLVELKRQQGDITAILETVKGIKDELGASIMKLQADFKDKLALTVQEIQTMFAKQLYDKLYTTVRDSAQWIEDHQTILKITAQDGPDKFKPLLFDHGNLLEQRDKLRACIGEIQTDVEKSGTVPAQQMLDLYLLAIHWLLIFDKVSSRELCGLSKTCRQKADIVPRIIVTRGIYARALYVDGQKWSYYLEAVNNLTNDINELRTHAIKARDVLRHIVTEIPKDREQKVKLVGEPDKPDKQYIEDEWPALSVGWIPLPTLRKELGLEESVEMISHKALALGGNNPKILIRLWQEYAVQAVEFSLGPARAVMNHLEENIRQWNSRVPVAPTKTLPPGEQHIKIDIVASKEEPKAKSFFLQDENFVGKKLKYTLTYCNTYGESCSSTWSEQKDVHEDTYAIKLQIHPIKFDNDPLDTLPRVKGPDNKDLAPQRSIRRRLYVGYTEDHGHKDVNIYLGEIDEYQEIVYHAINKKAVGSPEDPM